MRNDNRKLRKKFLNAVLILLLIFSSGNSKVQAQTDGASIYKGKFSLPAGSQDNVAYYQNSLTISINKTNTVTGKLNFKGGSATEAEEYIHFAGTFKGLLQGASFEATGTTTMLMLDNKQESTDHISFKLSGQISAVGNTSQITGRLSITNSEQDGGTQFLSFTANMLAGEGLQLKFPLGESPMVFDKGWKFGASCILNEGTESEVDLSENILWSGTATFIPGKGALSSPVFNKEGANKIILSVKDPEGNLLEKEFKVEVVKASKYAHTGCVAICPADAHGCPACPKATVGFITGSVSDVTINGLAAVVVGDNGTHAACCGPNTFELNDGDPNVLIHGKQAVELGAITEHCGGSGNVRKSIPSLGQVLIANDSAYYIDPWGNPEKVNDESYTRFSTKLIGTTYITREKGSLTLSLLPKGILTAGPNTQLKILSDEAGVMKIKVDKGNLFFNGQSTGPGEVIIELKDCGLVLKGTRFYLSVNDQFMKLDLIEGNVDLKFARSGEIVEIHEGESVISDFNSVTEKNILDVIAVKKQWKQIAESTPGIGVIEVKESEEKVGRNKFFTNKVFILTGISILLLALIAGFFRIRKKQKLLKKIQDNSLPIPPPILAKEDITESNPIIQSPIESSTPKFCTYCGTPLKPGSKFCSKCGSIPVK